MIHIVTVVVTVVAIGFLAIRAIVVDKKEGN